MSPEGPVLVMPQVHVTWCQCCSSPTSKVSRPLICSGNYTMIPPVTIVICWKRHYCEKYLMVPAGFKPPSSGWNLHHDSPCYSCNMLAASLLWYQQNSNPQVLDEIYTMIPPVTVVICLQCHYCGTSRIQTLKFWMESTPWFNLLQL